MKFICHTFKNCTGGDVVEISLSGSAANVQLMDSSNLSNYKNGRKYSYRGGLAKKSPIKLTIPSSGTWYVAVDMRGLRGSVKTSARILPKPLPIYNESPLSSIPSLYHDNLPSADDDKHFDIFISHASEDKDDVVRPLAISLRQEGLSVWYDEFELRIGDSLRRKIDKGLANSKFGLVVLSKSFISKGWTNYELDGIITKVVTGEQVILPIWHNITKNEIIAFSPSLADKLARNTATHTTDEIAKEIAELIRSHNEV